MNQTLNLINVCWKETKDALRCYKSQISGFPEPRSTEIIRILTKLKGTQAGVNYGKGFHVVHIFG